MRFFIIVCIVILTGCSAGSKTPVTAKIVSVTDKDDSAMGCIGTSYRTVVETDDGWRDRICGVWGKEGDTMRGFWVSGHWDASINGFIPF